MALELNTVQGAIISIEYRHPDYRVMRLRIPQDDSPDIVAEVLLDPDDVDNLRFML